MTCSWNLLCFVIMLYSNEINPCMAGKYQVVVIKKTIMLFQDKGDESGTTPSADSIGYASRPASEHESRVGSASYRSSGDQAKGPDSGGTESSAVAQVDSGAPMVAPLTQRQSASSTTPLASSATSSLATARPPSEQ